VVFSIFSTSQIERVEIRPLPTYTPTIAITPQPTVTTPESDDDFPPFILLKQVRTDIAGQYEFITSRPDRIISYYYYRRGGEFQPIYFHYRLSYQGNCPTSTRLLSTDTTSPENDSSTLPWKQLIRQVKPADTMLQGPVDITLPIPPPTSNYTEMGR
jgi:hypothetical protein